MTGDDVRVSTGIDGLDEVLSGGFLPRRSYMLRGNPGTGKTIVGMHYLLDGTEDDETVLFVNLEEREGEIRRNAEALGFDLDDVEFLDLTPSAARFAEEEQYDVFAPSDVEQESFIGDVVDRVEALEPDRIFFDPLTQLWYLTPDEHQFREQVLSAIRFFVERGATVLFTTEAVGHAAETHLDYLADGTLELSYTGDGRTLTVPKFRGSDVDRGPHAVRIDGSGMCVYPKLHPGEHGDTFDAEPISSGVPELDDLLHGGLERGTVSIISGPTGVGKTTMGTQFMKEASGRGERSVIYTFEETMQTFLNRSAAVNIPVEEMRARGNLVVEEIEALDYSPQRFASEVRRQVEREGAEIVMIDGISGYEVSIRGGDEQVARELHTLCRYLKNMGVTTVLIDEVGTITGEFTATGGKISYIADNLVFLRHIEFQGELRKVVGVLKKRMSDYERTLREFAITEHGIKVGEPLTELRGILSGEPELAGDASVRTIE